MARENYILVGVDDQDYHSRRQLAVVPSPAISAAAARAASRNSGFKLPEGWVIEEVPRSGSTHVDKYYYEPNTGRKFRSLIAVERHINGGQGEFSSSPRRPTRDYNYEKSSDPSKNKMIISSGKMVRLSEEIFNESSQLAIMAPNENAPDSPYNLPDGWVVEEVPRKHGSHSDKFFYEPGTGMKFRSLLAAQRHVAELNDDTPLSKAFKVTQGLRSASRKKKSARNEDQPSSFGSAPEKVEWVLANSQGNAWKPFVCDRAIPDNAAQEWKEKFMSSMNLNNTN